MSFSSLLCHSATVSTVSRTTAAGRSEETWTIQDTIPCRFSRPRTTRPSLSAGAVTEQIDATVFTGRELLEYVHAEMPVRLTTADPGWEGTYETIAYPRICCTRSPAVHHCECSVKKVHLP